MVSQYNNLRKVDTCSWFERNTEKRKPSASSRPLRWISSLRSDSGHRSDAPSAQTRLALSVRQEPADTRAEPCDRSAGRFGRLTNPRLVDFQRASPVDPVRRHKHRRERRDRGAQRVATGRAGEGFGSGVVASSASSIIHPRNDVPIPDVGQVELVSRTGTPSQPDQHDIHPLETDR